MKNTMQDGSNATVRELYTLVDQKMDQVNRSIMRVESKLDVLESGRLASLEKSVANMQGRLMMVPALVTIAVNVFFFIIELVLKKP